MVRLPLVGVMIKGKEVLQVFLTTGSAEREEKLTMETSSLKEAHADCGGKVATLMIPQ